MNGFWKAVLVAALGGASQAVTTYQMTGGQDPVALAVHALVGAIVAVGAYLQKSPLP